jgi:hypothetical protein
MNFFFMGLFLLLRLAGFSQDQKPILPTQKNTRCSLFDRDLIGESSFDSAEVQARLLATYNNQARLVRSIKAVAVIHATRGPKFGPKAGTSHPVTGFFDFDQPASLRVTGVAPPLGKKVFDLASDGREFRLLAPDHEIVKLYIGLVDAQPNFSAISVPEISDIARPREILDALRWQEGTLRKTRSTGASENDTLEFDLPPRAGNPIIGKLKFDSKTGALASLQIRDAHGELISEIFYADWQAVAAEPADASKGCFPRRVQLVQPMEDVQLDFRFLEMTLNPRLSRVNFRVSPPPGTPVIRLSTAGVAKEL